MRRTLAYLAFTLALSIAVYLGLGSEAYVLIHTSSVAIQMTLWVAIILFCIALLILALMWNIINGVVLGGWHRAWMRRRQEKLASSAVKSYMDQGWDKAYKQLVKLANSHPDPQPYVMMAADAAVASGDIDRGRETYQQALARFPEAAFQTRLKMAYLELGVGNYQQADQLCKKLLAEKKRDPEARLLQILIAEDQADWESMHSLIEQARNQKVLSARLPMIERRYLRACLASGASAPHLTKLAELEANNTSVPVEASIILARQLAMKGQAEKAEFFLRKQIEHTWDPELVSAYGNIEGKSARGQVKVAEAWLNRHPDEPALLETLKVLSLRANDDQRARSYEEKLRLLKG